MAENFYKRIKTLRHPHILKYIDGLELSDMLIVVTEEVIPLHRFNEEVILTAEKSSTRNMIIAWGFHCLLKALEFVNSSCGLLHGSLSPDSILVTPGGDFKLAGFFVTDKIDEISKSLPRIYTENLEVLSSIYQSPERQSNSFSAIVKAKDTVDIWGAACILYECFNGRLINSEALVDTAKIPPLLRKVYKKMLSSNPFDRPNAGQVYTSQGFTRAFGNKFVKVLLFFEEIQIKNDIEKIEFLKKLEADVSDFPLNACLYKILPALNDLQSFENNAKAQGLSNANTYEINVPSVVLNIVIKICKKLDGAPTPPSDANVAEVKKKVLIPCIMTMFNCNDRQTRIILLDNLKLYVDHLDEQAVNKEIFPKVITGFTDSTVPLRESTLKSMISLAPKLNDGNMNDVLVKHLIKLLDDPEPSIVTNTVICLSRILQHFNAKTRPKIIVGVFPRALKSRFYHTKIAALKAIFSSLQTLIPAEQGSAVQQTLDESISNGKLLASKLVPAVGMALLDESSEVRSEGFRAMNQILEKLTALSSRMKKGAADTPAVQGTTGKTETQPSSSASYTYIGSATNWASSLTKRMSQRDRKSVV